MKKKVLIMTLFHQNYNYGGMLQAYALYTKLNDLGVECQELDYDASKTVHQRIINKILEMKEKGIRNTIAQKAHKMSQKAAVHKYIQKYDGDPLKTIFDQFTNQEFRKTSLYNQKTIKRIKEPYDICVVGGDQMWNPEWYDRNYYLTFSNARYNFAYSCSIGKDTITKREERQILSYIKKLNSISVRESSAQEWFFNRGYCVELVCDPVFLISRNEWEEFSAGSARPYKEEYIFTYLLGEGLEVRTQIKRMAEKLGLKIVSIPHVWRRYNPNDEGFADYAPINVGPREFINILKNAKYVLTDSFHGTAFSIIFEKNFYCFSRFKSHDDGSQNSRLLSILGLLELNNRYISLESIADTMENFNEKIDYKNVNIALNIFRKESEQFLTQQLKMEERAKG